MTTQIATTQDQSARLLRCEVSPDTADMCWTRFESDGEKYEQLSVMDESAYEVASLTPIPAWSLSSLLGLLPKEIKVDESPYDEIQKYGLLIYPYMGGWQVDYQYCEDDECHCLKCVYGADLIEACVKAIEWLTANGYQLNGIEKGGSEQ